MLTSGTYDERRYIVNEERPGEFKKHGHVTRINEVGPPPEAVEPELTALAAAVMESGAAAPLKAGPVFTLGLSTSTPLPRGTVGWAGRSPTTGGGSTTTPPLIVHDEDKRACYDALRAVRRRSSRRWWIFSRGRPPRPGGGRWNWPRARCRSAGDSPTSCRECRHKSISSCRFQPT